MQALHIDHVCGRCKNVGVVVGTARAFVQGSVRTSKVVCVLLPHANSCKFQMNARESKAAIAKKVQNVFHFCTSILNFGFICSKIRQRGGRLLAGVLCLWTHFKKGVQDWGFYVVGFSECVGSIQRFVNEWREREETLRCCNFSLLACVHVYVAQMAPMFPSNNAVYYLQPVHLFLRWIQIMWVNLCFSFDLQLASMELDFEVTLSVRVEDTGCPYPKLWNPKNSSLCMHFAGFLLGVVKANRGNFECMSLNNSCTWMHVYW